MLSSAIRHLSESTSVPKITNHNANKGKKKTLFIETIWEKLLLTFSFLGTLCVSFEPRFYISPEQGDVDGVGRDVEAARERGPVLGEVFHS